MINLEVFLTALCISTNEQSCISIAQAYYKQSGIEKPIGDLAKQFEEKNKKLVQVAGVASAVNQKTLIIPVFSHTVVGFKIRNDDNIYNLTYNQSF